MTAATHEEIYKRGAAAPSGAMVGVGAVLAVLGMGLFAFLAGGDDPGRAWRIFHVDFVFFTGIAMGAVIFAAIQKVVRGKWAGPIIRLAEAAVAFLPVALVLFLLLFLGRDHLFPWIEHPTPVRGNWLTVTWVFWRDFLALLVLFSVAIAFVYHDLRPDVSKLRGEVNGWKLRLYEMVAGSYDDSEAHRELNDRRIYRLAPWLILLYAYLFSLIGFDLIMSLAPYWISNLFGAYYFMGSFLTGLTMLGLMTVYWRAKLQLHEIVGEKIFHDLGKLIFGFTMFWAYLVYSQFLVIWYGNLAEETSFLFYRLWGEWRPVGLLVGILVFLVPFCGLIWVKSKITPFTFTLFVTISLFGMWLERYLLVQPSLTEMGPAFGLVEFGVTAGFLGLFLLSYGLFARAFPMVSPRLSQKALHSIH
ncbi:MAG: polysulfide reductase NrfD [Gemmatimonadetes bacterium]|nr:polysulfide reductase NrfD [Gemmatimonadota bacterium]